MKKRKTVIKNGHLVDPKAGVDKVCTLILEEGIVKDIVPEGGNEFAYDEETDIVDATGMYVFPGLIDLHVHFREPGFEYKETIETGAKAAAAGGFTTVCVMPNTKPVIDSAEKVKWVVDKAKETACINVLPISSVTIGQNGTELVDIEAVKAAGAVALSEDGKSVDNSDLMREAMIRAQKAGIPVFDHCEAKWLLNGGVMNKGRRAEELGLPGISLEVEDTIAERDIALAKSTGVRLHLCHCSTGNSPVYIEKAKKEGVSLTAETGPHYISLCDEDIPSDDAKWKMNPPLRGRNDMEMLRTAVVTGVVDVIATDHAPHSTEEKSGGFKNSPFGIVGLETAFPVCYTELVKSGRMTLSDLINRMSAKPAEILGLDSGTLEKGHPADVVIADLSEEYAIDKDAFKSKGRNTPFDRRTVYGKIIKTFVGGKLV